MCVSVQVPFYLLFVCFATDFCGCVQLFTGRCILPSSAVQESIKIRLMHSSRPWSGNDLSMPNCVALSLSTVQLQQRLASAPGSKPQAEVVTRQVAKAAAIHLVEMSITEQIRVTISADGKVLACCRSFLLK